MFSSSFFISLGNDLLCLTNRLSNDFKRGPKGNINKFFISRFSILIGTLLIFEELEIEGKKEEKKKLDSIRWAIIPNSIRLKIRLLLRKADRFFHFLCLWTSIRSISIQFCLSFLHPILWAQSKFNNGIDTSFRLFFFFFLSIHSSVPLDFLIWIPEYIYDLAWLNRYDSNVCKKCTRNDIGFVNDDEIIRPKITSHWLRGLECIDHTLSCYPYFVHKIQFNVKNIIID